VNQPNTVLFDIQNDQRAGVEALLRRNGMAPMQNAPVVTMRLSTVKGTRVEELLKQNRDGVPPWVLRREYRSTYRDGLVETEQGVGGKWPQKEQNGIIPISLEEGIAKDLRVRVGDAMTFDVQGVEVATRVAHLRKVDWRRMAPNLFVVFPDGALEAAPAFHIMTTKAPNAEAGAQVQREMVKMYPDVSMIDMSLVLKTVDSIVTKVSFAVRFMAYFTLGTGLLVLMATVLTGRYQRIQESILLRTLGASRAQVLKVLVAEYLLLGLCASATGVGLALTAAWALAPVPSSCHRRHPSCHRCTSPLARRARSCTWRAAVSGAATCRSRSHRRCVSWPS
jgi:putative ABC transport system permease protein